MHACVCVCCGGMLCSGDSVREMKIERVAHRRLHGYNSFFDRFFALVV